MKERDRTPQKRGPDLLKKMNISFATRGILKKNSDLYCNKIQSQCMICKSSQGQISFMNIFFGFIL